MQKQLYLSNNNKMIAGVCGGLAEYFDVDPVIVRIIFIVLAIGVGGGVLAYILLWIIVPRAPFVIVTPNKEENDDNNQTNMNPVRESDTDFKPERINGSKIFVSVLLIALGLLWLLDNIMPNIHFISFWPIALIIIGILILMKSKNK